MSVNFFDLAKEYLTPSVISNFSSELGENESGVSKAVSAFIPIILGSLVEKNQGISGLFHTLKTFGASRGLNSLSTTASVPDTINELKNGLFGGNVQNIITKVSEFAGISTNSSAKLLDVTSEATLGGIGKYAEDHNMTEASFMSVLGDHKSLLASFLPAGLGLGTLGLGNLFGGAKENVTAAVKETITPKAKPYVEPVRVHEEPEKGSSMWKWLIPLILLALAGFLLLKYCNKADTPVVATPTGQDSMTNDTMIDEPMVEKTYGEVDLEGVKLKAFANGLESKMIDFLQSPDYANATEEQLKDRWFDFDNINFEFGTTDKLIGDSHLQLENLAVILKKYPEAKIKIGAYTDNVGDAVKNKELSQKRADYLKAELSKLGVEAQVIGAEGYGEEFATVAETASDEERAADRKMSLRFSK